MRLLRVGSWREDGADVVVLSSWEGIWTKILSNKTGLPRQNITKALKSLESRKVVKTVKSVKVRSRVWRMKDALVLILLANPDPYAQDLHAFVPLSCGRDDRRTLVHRQRARYRVRQYAQKVRPSLPSR